MKKFIITVNGKPYEVEVEEVKSAKTPRPSTNNTPVASEPEKKATHASASGKSVKIDAPMPGSILKINVNAGDAVKQGQALLILEAMKMENEITAPADGKVLNIKVTKGDCVSLGQTLIEIG